MSVREKHIQRLEKGSTAEFAPVLLVLFVIVLFPLINFFGTAIGYANACAMSIRWASIAAGATGMESGTALVERDSSRSMQTGLASLVKLNLTSIRVYGIRTHIMNGSVEYIGPKKRANPPLNTTDYVYEYMTKAEFEQQPFVSMSSVPGLMKIPGLSAPFKYTLSQMRAVEHLEGLIHDPVLASNSSVSVDLVSDDSNSFDSGEWKTGWPP